MISKETWGIFVAKYGVHESRGRLRAICRPVVPDLRVRKLDASSAIANLVQGYSEPAAQRRLHFAQVIREALRISRERRERIFSYCAPGVRRQMLP